AAVTIRNRRLIRWLTCYACASGRRCLPGRSDEVHLLLCVADHFEPKAYGAGSAQGRRRVRHWLHEFPRQFGRFRDSDGRPPRHTFFFPIEEYEAEYLDDLAELSRLGYGEVEIHLHHHHDTAADLRDRLVRFRDLLIERHNLLARRRDNG